MCIWTDCTQAYVNLVNIYPKKILLFVLRCSCSTETMSPNDSTAKWAQTYAMNVVKLDRNGMQTKLSKILRWIIFDSFYQIDEWCSLRIYLFNENSKLYLLKNFEFSLNFDDELFKHQFCSSVIRFEVPWIIHTTFSLPFRTVTQVYR